MRPLIYSKKEAKFKHHGWRRDGTEIGYWASNCSPTRKRNGVGALSQPVTSSSSLYTLSFNLSSHYDNDTVYLAHCYPYTYSDL